MLAKKILDSFNGKRCLVTGGTGMIGREVVKILCNANAKVKVVSLDNIIIDNRADHILADLTDLNVCKDVTNKIDYVFHIFSRVF